MDLAPNLFFIAHQLAALQYAHECIRMKDQRRKIYRTHVGKM